MKNIDKKSVTSFCLDISTKDGREFRFSFSSFDKDNLGEKIHERLKMFVFSEDIKFAFAFAYKGEYPINGWEVYNDIKEWKRMGINFDVKVILYLLC